MDARRRETKQDSRKPQIIVRMVFGMNPVEGAYDDDDNDDAERDEV